MAVAMRGLVAKVGGTGAAARVAQRQLIPTAGKVSSLSARRLFSSIANEDQRVKMFKMDVQGLFFQPNMKSANCIISVTLTKPDMEIMRLQIRY